MFILLDQCFVDGILNPTADAQTAQLIVVARRIHPVAQEDVDQILIRIHPKAGPCKACMTIHRDGGQITARRGFRIARYRFVEAQSAAAGRTLALCEESHGLG